MLCDRVNKWPFKVRLMSKKSRSPRREPDSIVRVVYALWSARLIRLANVLRPHPAHLPPGYFVAHPDTLFQRPGFGTGRYVGMMNEYRFASVVRVDEAVTT